MRITGFMPLYNGIYGQYPFLEMIALALPLVDEFLVNDGGSTDGTREVLEEAASLNRKIKIVDYPHVKGDAYQGLDDAIEYTMSQATGDWLIEIQADEYFPVCFHDRVKQNIKHADKYGFNSIRHTRFDTEYLHFNNFFDMFFDEGDASKTIRIFKNLPNIKSYDGGDNFCYQDNFNSKQYTRHDLSPEYETNNFISVNMLSLFPIDVFIRQQMHCNHYDVNHSDEARYEKFLAAQKELNVKETKIINLKNINITSIKNFGEQLNSLKNKNQPSKKLSHEILESLIKQNYYTIRKEIFEYIKNENLIYKNQTQYENNIPTFED